MLHKCCFIQLEGKTLHWQKNYDSLYGDTHFIAVVWNETHYIRDMPVNMSLKKKKDKKHPTRFVSPPHIPKKPLVAELFYQDFDRKQT